MGSKLARTASVPSATEEEDDRWARILLGIVSSRVKDVENQLCVSDLLVGEVLGALQGSCDFSLVGMDKAG